MFYLEFVSRIHCHFRCSNIEIVGDVCETVIVERNALRVEGVGLNDVRTSLEVIEVNAFNEMRTCYAQQIIVAFQ